MVIVVLPLKQWNGVLLVYRCRRCCSMSAACWTAHHSHLIFLTFTRCWYKWQKIAAFHKSRTHPLFLSFARGVKNFLGGEHNLRPKMKKRDKMGKNEMHKNTKTRKTETKHDVFDEAVREGAWRAWVLWSTHLFKRVFYKSATRSSQDNTLLFCVFLEFRKIDT